MGEHFNGLTPAQAERLFLLLEEMGEAQQAIGKILRHGYVSVDPTVDEDDINNASRLEKELGDVRHAMIRLCDARDLSKDNIHRHAEAKAKSVAGWLHHQP